MDRMFVESGELFGHPDDWRNVRHLCECGTSPLHIEANRYHKPFIPTTNLPTHAGGKIFEVVVEDLLK